MASTEADSRHALLDRISSERRLSPRTRAWVLLTFAERWTFAYQGAETPHSAARLALKFFEQRPNEPQGRSAAHLVLARLDFYQGRLQSAERHLDAAEALLLRVSDPSALADVDLIRARRRLFAGETSSTFPILLRSLVAASSAPNRGVLGRAWHSIGLALMYSDRHLEALDALSTAVSSFLLSRDLTGAASVMKDLSGLHRFIGDLDLAARYGGEAIAVHALEGDLLGTANALHHMGTLARRRGSLDESITHLHQAAVHHRTISNPLGLSGDLLELAHSLRERGAVSDLVRAEAVLDELNAIPGTSPFIIASAIKERGRLRLQQGQPELARQLLRRAVRAHLALSDPDYRGAGTAGVYLGEALLEMNRVRAASEVLGTALEQLDESGDVDAWCHGAKLQAEVLNKRGLGDLAVELARKAARTHTEIRMRQTFTVDREAISQLGRPVYRTAIELAFKNNDKRRTVESLEYVQTAGLNRVLREVARETLEEAGEVGHLLRRRYALEASLTQAHASMSATPHRQELAGELAEVQEHLDRVAPQLQGLLSTTPVGAKVTEQLIHDGADALVVHLDPQRQDIWSAFLERSGAVHLHHHHMNEKETRAIDRVSNPSAERSEGQALAPLADLLLPPRLRTIIGEATEPLDLLVVPSGGLWGVPIPALPVDGGQMVDTVRTFHCPSLGAYQAIRPWSPTPITRVLAYADPGLGGATREVEAIRNLFTETESVKGDDLLQALKSTADFDMVMIGAHADKQAGLDQSIRPAGSRKIRSAEILSGSHAPLVIAGACFSLLAFRQVGCGEPLGIATSFLAGGSSVVIGGYRELYDEPTSVVLMAAYKAIADGADPATALQVSMQTTLRTLPSDRGPVHLTCLGRPGPRRSSHS